MTNFCYLKYMTECEDLSKLVTSLDFFNIVHYIGRLLSSQDLIDLNYVFHE